MDVLFDLVYANYYDLLFQISARQILYGRMVLKAM